MVRSGRVELVEAGFYVLYGMGVNLILMREGIVWVCWVGLEFVTWVVVGWSGEVSIGLLAGEGCIWVVVVCSGGGGVGSGGVQSGSGCVGLVLLGFVLLGTCRISLECLLFLTQGVKFSGAGLSSSYLAVSFSDSLSVSSKSVNDFSYLCSNSSMILCCPCSIQDSS